jgi:hypothetical protein
MTYVIAIGAWAAIVAVIAAAFYLAATPARRRTKRWAKR